MKITYQNSGKGNDRRGRCRKIGNYHNVAEQENKPFNNTNQNSNTNSRTSVSNRSEQNENKVMPVQNQDNIVAPRTDMPIAPPPPPFPMTFWFIPPQLLMSNFDPNVWKNFSAVEERLNQIRENEEQQREDFDVTSTQRSFQERRNRRYHDDGSSSDLDVFLRLLLQGDFEFCTDFNIDNLNYSFHERTLRKIFQV
ncbi:hypothetical protein V9T40_003365 [Parthenolecanium corni]|uniref:Uncharacterized protein n=1 Tax=Parthenolecanium corni TaxID=536013 RepID=A0AAN9Y8T3_9HEMI